jgi:hypothetical protein
VKARAGGERITAEQALAWARAHGAVPHVVDGTEVHSEAEALDAIGAALGAPQRFPSTLGGLFECLGDLSWLPEGEHVLIWAHHQLLAERDWSGYHQVRAVLRDGAGSGGARRLTVLFTPS